jgi:uncharacterized coiled-coil protein SlyX
VTPDTVVRMTPRSTDRHKWEARLIDLESRASDTRDTLVGMRRHFEEYLSATETRLDSLERELADLRDVLSGQGVL